MTVKDITRARKTYSYYRSVPDIIEATATNTVVYSDFKGFENGGWSPVARAANGTYTTVASAGNFNVGRQFFYDNFAAESNVSFTGIRFWWPGGVGAKTIRCRLYTDNGNTQLASADVAVNASGIYSCTFASPVPLTAADAYMYHVVAIWETTGAYYVNVTGYSAIAYEETLGVIIPATRGLYWLNWKEQAGNNNPVTNGSTDPYPVEPVIEATI